LKTSFARESLFMKWPRMESREFPSTTSRIKFKGILGIKMHGVLKSRKGKLR
jgi:hypothetical protein